jgi:hypothetical protein
MKRAYQNWKPSAGSLALVDQAEAICNEYQAQGYDLTLRQLYYQFVSRDLIPNNLRSYKRLGSVINDARMGGMLDWDSIVDRTRNLRGTSHWSNPSSVIHSAASSYRIDKWHDQPTRVELWVEKEALAGVIERTAAALDLDWFACRGYVSQSEQWAAGRRFLNYIEDGQNVVILHLGDHDPSGIDMTRDIEDRLRTFIYTDYAHDHLTSDMTAPELFEQMRDQLREPGEPFEVRRIALNMDQVEQYDPPPNPAKLTDSRASGYVTEYGEESWELDALDPATLDQLIRDEVDHLRIDALYDVAEGNEEDDRDTLRNIADSYADVAAMFGRE